MLAREGPVWRENHFAVGTAEVGVEELKEAGVAEQGVAERNRHETNYRAPLVGFVEIGDAQQNWCKAATDRAAARKMNVSWRHLPEVQPDYRCNSFREHRVIRTRIEVSISNREVRRPTYSYWHNGTVALQAATQRRLRA